MASIGRVAATESILITLSNWETEKGGQILVKVQRGENVADHIWYCIGRNTILQHLMLDYTQRSAGVGIALSSVRFLYDGSVIKKFSTADDLKMEDGDVIDVINVCDTSTTCIPKEETRSISLIVRSQDGRQSYYNIGRKTPLRKLMLDFCRRNGIGFNAGGMRFVLCGKGRLINPDETADDLGLEDKGVIDAILSQTGC